MRVRLRHRFRVGLKVRARSGMAASNEDASKEISFATSFLFL